METTCPKFVDDFNLTMIQCAKVGVLSLQFLENMLKAEVKATLRHEPSQIMGAAMCLGVCMHLNADHKVLKVLGIDVDGLTATITNNVFESDRQATQIPEDFTEKFCKVIPSPSDSTILQFMDCFYNILMDFGLAV